MDSLNCSRESRRNVFGAYENFIYVESESGVSRYSGAIKVMRLYMRVTWHIGVGKWYNFPFMRFPQPRTDMWVRSSGEIPFGRRDMCADVKATSRWSEVNFFEASRFLNFSTRSLLRASRRTSEIPYAFGSLRSRRWPLDYTGSPLSE